MANIHGIEVQWLGHDSFLLEHGGTRVCIDPFKLAAAPKADIILVTHDHFDHCDPASVDKLRGPGTVVLAPFGCSVKLKGFRAVAKGETITENGVKIEVVAAYNIGKPYHSREMGVGYVISIGGRRVYHAGDTDRIPEMKKLGAIDIALLPVSGTYVMNAEEAASAANEDIKPRVAVPMHYGTIIGSQADAEKFKSLCECDVVLL